MAVFFCEGAASALEADGNECVKKGAVKNIDEQEKSSSTTHRIGINGKELRYTATAGELFIEHEREQDKKEESKGRLFYVAYELDGTEKSDRPVTFVFNGGPGAASVWLHLGGLGPKRITLKDGRTPPPPVLYEENPHSWIPFTDIVFVDPIGTGFSRSVPDYEKTRKIFYGVQQDIQSVAEFIRLYLTRFNRWMSPKFLAGESYGTTRVAGLTRYLQQRFGIDLNGVILISPVLDYDTILFHPSNDLPYILFLPTYAAIARYHDVLPEKEGSGNLREWLSDAEDFTLKKYITYLAKGENLDDEQEKELKKLLYKYTSISQDLIDKNNFRISWAEYVKNLLGDRGLIVGRMDGTITGTDPDPGNLSVRYDPSLDPLFGPFSSGMNAYVREELKFESDLFYEFLNHDVAEKWDWRSGLTKKQGFLDVSHTLRDAIAVNKNLRVFIASGYYDLATPYFAAQYTVSHMWLGDGRANITMKTYEAGHMIYTHTEELRQLTEDAREFYRESTAIMGD
jgi:carboxypeptidase C (cathepsin A)